MTAFLLSDFMQFLWNNIPRSMAINAENMSSFFSIAAIALAVILFNLSNKGVLCQ